MDFRMHKKEYNYTSINLHDRFMKYGNNETILLYENERPDYIS